MTKDIRIRVGSLLLAISFFTAVLAGHAAAEETGGMEVVLPPELQECECRLTDGDFNSRVTLREDREIILKPGEDTAAVLLSWYSLPEQVTITQNDLNGDTVGTLQTVGAYETQVALEDGCAEIIVHADKECTLSELTEQTEQEAESFVNLEICDKADLLLTVSHPSDESLVFRGLLPYYAGIRNMTVQVVYMSFKNRTQIQEALSVLKVCGVGIQPVFLDNLYLSPANCSVKTMEGAWDKSENREKLTALIRRYRPEIVVTHEENGEDGDSARAVTFEYTRDAVELAANEGKFRDTVRQYGIWETRKFYSHSEKGKTVLRTDETFPDDRGLTAAELSGECLKLYETMATYRLRGDKKQEGFKLESGITEGEKNAEDLFLNIPDEDLTERLFKAVPISAFLKNRNTDDNSSGSLFRKPGEKEKIVSNYKKGKWEYSSDILSVQIERKEGKNSEKKPIVYYVAHIRMNGADAYRSGFGNILENGEGRDQPWKIARRYKAVLAITGDNLIDSGISKKGVLIRNGRLYSNGNGKVPALAFDRDMSMRICSAETDAQSILDDGIQNTYAFGPVLAENGEVNPETRTHALKGKNPRAGIGMVEPGHLVAIVVEGRKKGYSEGVTLEDFAKLFLQEECTVAYNMDGGASSGMVFMGEHVNLEKSPANQVNRLRPWPDALLFGYSEKVPEVNEKVLYTGIAEESAEENEGDNAEG